MIGFAASTAFTIHATPMRADEITGIATLMLRDAGPTGGRAACARHPVVRRHLARKDGRIRDDAALVALRDARRWPCGATVEIILPRTGRRTTAIVADRGPAGVTCAGGRKGIATREELRRDRPPDGCAWNAVVDATAAVHEALESDGYEWVRVRATWRKR